MSTHPASDDTERAGHDRNVDPLLDAELRALRARAYGPTADIHDDPIAVARLRQLEDRVAGRALGADSETAAAAGDLGGPVAIPAPTTPVSPTARASPPRARRDWGHRRLAAAWVMSLALTVAVTAWAVGLLARDDGGRVEAVLAEIPDFTLPDSVAMPGQVRGFEEFHGLQPLSSRAAWNGEPETACLVVVASDFLGAERSVNERGMIFVGGEDTRGCEAGRFPASLQRVVTEDMPDSLLQRFPVGTALRFVLDGDEIVVLSDR
ncbi:hypothetical protein [Microbacterium marinilacus]|uniref:Uncharacterized protein n=1 Tax=Microbacterium marinilacus TaxID=415209 RepID=A0ABP7BIZ7_9MICO|nr:hypothetical protein [Microbacterium marinilacus]MBY0688467.1 hypothetical protein [Microbacterium marinilacus]